MEVIQSFTIDHTRLKPGIYVSREDKGFTTFDLRITEPNQEPAVAPAAMHSLEHLMATWFRNSEAKEDVVLDWMRLEFDDDKKHVIVETPGGNRITVSDDEGGILFEDQHGNKVTLNSDGITLDSAKDLVLKAKGDVKAEGTNINFNANAQLVAKGSGSAEISSSGNTVVKGSLVQIN